MTTERLVVGRVVKPHGLRGEVVVEVLTEVEGRFAAGVELFVGEPDGAPEARRVRASRPHQGRMLVTFDGVADRDGAEALRGAFLSIDAADAVAPEPGRYFAHQLEGLDVVDEDGAPLGRLTGVLESPANDLWVVRHGERDVLVPAVKEFVRDVDLDARRVVVRPIPGLFD